VSLLKDRPAPPEEAFVPPSAPSSGAAAVPEDHARPATVCQAGCVAACPEFGPWGGDAVEITITNRTGSEVRFTLSNGRHVGTYLLEPAESTCGRGLGGAYVTFRDGRARSSELLRSGQHYQFVERGGLFLLEKTW
jgi:hypothetical protein